MSPLRQTKKNLFLYTARCLTAFGGSTWQNPP